METNIIGGADGPTSIYLSSTINPYAIVAIVVVCIAVIGLIFWKIKKRK